MSNLDWLDVIARPEQVCPNMPQHAFEMLGRLEAPEYAMPKLPQHAPTQKSMKGTENKEELAPGEVGGQEIKCAAKTFPVHLSADCVRTGVIASTVANVYTFWNGEESSTVRRSGGRTRAAR
ncbi:MAG: hypothetical protein ACYCY1_02575 [Sulfuriferula sp.]